MLEFSLPALNNALLAAALVMSLGLAHVILRKRNMLGKNDMRNRVHVAWGIALIGLPAVLYPKSLGFLLWAYIPLLAWQEWLTEIKISAANQEKTWWLGVSIYATQLASVVYLAPSYTWTTGILPTVFVLAIFVIRSTARWVFTGVVSTLLLPAMALPLLMNARLSVLVWCFIIPQLFDAFQYIIGRQFGRTSLSRWSPKKTWEGLMGGAFAAWFCAMMLSPWLPWEIIQTAQITVLLLGASYFGGLASSMLKRLLNVKDWGCRLGSHGGVLDRIDSLILAIPIAWFFYTWHLYVGI